VRKSGSHCPRVKIPLEVCRIPANRGKRDIPIGPDKVEGVSLESNITRRVLPGERVQRDSARSTDRRNACSRFAADMHLPIKRRQRRVVVSVAVVELDPRQPVSSANVARTTNAQRTAAILDRRLRNRTRSDASPLTRTSAAIRAERHASERTVPAVHRLPLVETRGRLSRPVAWQMRSARARTCRVPTLASATAALQRASTRD